MSSETSFCSTGITINLVQGYARDLSAIIKGFSAVKPAATGEELAALPPLTSCAEHNNAALHSYRGTRCAAVGMLGNSRLIALPTIRGPRPNYFSMITAPMSAKDVMIDPSSVLSAVPSKGVLCNAVKAMVQPGDENAPATYVTSGQFAEPVVMALACLAAEHAIIPINQPIIPVEAGASVINTQMADDRTAAHCIRNPTMLSDMVLGTNKFGFPDNTERIQVVPIYVPGPEYIKAMSLITALARNNGPYRQRIQTVWSVVLHCCVQRS